jgi:hypothetical protein
MSERIELAGGPYVVRTNKNNGIEHEYGWAELVIEKNNIKVICDNDGYISTILNFNINVEIPRDYKYLQLIEIYLKNGFGSKFAYNYSKVEVFKTNCINYFNRLQNDIINDNNNK